MSGVDGGGKPTHLTRRAAVAGVVIPAVSACGAACEAADAELLAMIAALRRIDREERAIDQEDTFDCDLPAGLLARRDGLRAEWSMLLDAISACPAETRAGLTAKATIVVGLANTTEGGTALFEGADSFEVMAWSLCQDILAGRGA